MLNFILQSENYSDIVVINDATFGPSRFAKNDDMNIIIKTGATHRRSSNMADDVFSDEPSDAYRKLNTKVENNISDSVPLIRKKRHTGTATINTPTIKYSIFLNISLICSFIKSVIIVTNTIPQIISPLFTRINAQIPKHIP